MECHRTEPREAYRFYIHFLVTHIALEKWYIRDNFTWEVYYIRKEKKIVLPRRLMNDF